MGVHHGITHEKFPEQGSQLGARVKVCFHHDPTHTVRGYVVRDDRDAPGHTIIRLDDGRHVLGTECQYAPDVAGTN
jgi:hypothetical protein